MSHDLTGTLIDKKYFLYSIAQEQEKVITYHAWHIDWEMPLFIKVVSNINDQERKQFIKEANEWIELGIHPNFLSAYFFREIDSRLFLFLESISGSKLSDIKEHLSLEDILTIALEIANSIAYQHDEGIVYNNLLSENVLLDKYGRVRLNNIRWHPREGIESLARGFRSNFYSNLTKIEDILALRKKAFKWLISQPPEYFLDKDYRSNTKSDIYSFGILFYEMLMHAAPFSLEQETESLFSAFKKKHQKKQSFSLPVTQEKALNQFHELLNHCLKPDTGQRPDSFEKIILSLQQIYEDYTGKPYIFESWSENALLAMSLNNRALGHIDRQEWQEAEKILKEVSYLDTAAIASPVNRSLIKLRLEKTSQPKFLDHIQKCRFLKEEPIAFLSARVCLEYGSLTQEIYDDLKKISRWDEKLQIAKGDLSYRLGYYQESREIYKEQIKKQQNQDVWYRFGACLMALKLTKDAKEAWEEGLKKNLPLWDLIVGYSMLLSMQGNWAIARHYLDTLIHNDSNYLRHFTSYTWSQVRSLQVSENSAVLDAAISTDNRYIFARTSEGKSHVWEWPSGRKCKDNAPVLAPHATGRILQQALPVFVTDIAISYETSLAITANGDSIVRLWDLKDRKCLYELQGHTNVVTAVAITPDGKTGISASMDKTLLIWDLENKVCLGQRKGHEDCILSLALSQNARIFISGGWDRKIRIWSLDQEDCIGTLEGYSKDIHTLAINAHATLAVSIDSGYILKIWNIAEKKLIGILQGHRAKVTKVAISLDARLVVSCSIDGTLAVYEDISQRPCPCWTKACYIVENLPAPVPLSERQEKFALEKEIHNLLSGEITHIELQKYQKLLRLELKTHHKKMHLKTISQLNQAFLKKGIAKKQVTEYFPMRVFLHDSPVVAFVLDKDIIYSISQKGIFKRWDMEKCQSDFYWHKPLWKTSCMGFSSEKDIFCFSGEDGILHTWSPCSDIWKEIEGHPSPIQCLKLFERGKKVVSGSKDGTIQLWDVEKGYCIWARKQQQGLITAIAITPKEDMAVTACLDGKIFAWDLEKGECVVQSQQQSSPLLSLDIQNTEQMIWFTAGIDGTIRQWNAQTGLCESILKAEKNAITSLSLAKDGTSLLYGTQSGDIKIWDIINTKCILKMEKAHDSSVRQIFFSEDKEWVFSGSQDGAIKVWKLLF